MKVKVVNKSSLPLPVYKTEGSSGIDLYASNSNPIVLDPMERALIPTGLFISIPQGFEAQIRARSGLAIKHGITLANGVGTIDSDYRGEIKVILINLGQEKFKIEKGDRIAQLILASYELVDFELVEELDETSRSHGGFGHTGLKD